MDNKQEDMLFDAYEQWRMHPVTKEFVSCLEKHKKRLVDSMSNSANDPSTTDATIRFFAIGVRNIDAIAKIVTNYEVFKQLVEKR